MYCFNCDKMVDFKKKKVNNEYTINDDVFNVEEYEYTCVHCGSELIDEVLDEQLSNIYETYLSIYSLKQTDFKDIRKSVNLSQELFAKALGWSKKTINRYENGETYPQKEYLKIYKKLKNNKDEIVTILNDNKIKLGNDYYKILNKINTTLDIKTINVFLYMLKDNNLYETQIMKNLFAVDFYSKKYEGHPISKMRYAKAPYGPIIDDRENILNFLLQHDYLKLVYTNDDKVKFSVDKKYDLSVFDKNEIKIMNYVKKKLLNKSSIELSEWSHTFEGWKKTKNGEIIDYNKFADAFDLERGWQ